MPVAFDPSLNPDLKRFDLYRARAREMQLKSEQATDGTSREIYGGVAASWQRLADLDVSIPTSPSLTKE